METEIPDNGKLYWSIGEVAALYQVRPSLIRFWEKEFPMIKPNKNKKGDRFFSREDVKTFGLIYHLVKERGFTLQGAREKLREKPEQISVTADVTDTLKNIRNFLIELKKELPEGEAEEQSLTDEEAESTPGTLF
jgi:DNA-binding transcriptional MerR regulator